MTEPRVKRRPLPALIALAALTLLTALVWWRVLHRDSGHAESTSSSSSSCPTSNGQTVLPRQSNVTLSVLNSTTRSGLARTTAATLSKRGFKVSGYGNDTGHGQIAGVAEIRFGPDEKSAATLLGFYFTHATLVPLPNTSSGKLVVSLGRTFKAVTPSTEVTAALKAAKVSLGGSGSGAATGSTC